MSQDQVEIAGVVVTDATREGCPVTYVSPGFEQLTGYAAADMLGRRCSVLQGPDTDPRAVEVLRHAIASGTEAYVTILNYRADGTPFWNEVALAPQRDADGCVVRYLGVQKDVTARRLADGFHVYHAKATPTGHTSSSRPSSSRSWRSNRPP
jgi:PAS domain S-box-containing protein